MGAGLALSLPSPVAPQLLSLPCFPASLAPCLGPTAMTTTWWCGPPQGGPTTGTWTMCLTLLGAPPPMDPPAAPALPLLVPLVLEA